MTSNVPFLVHSLFSRLWPEESNQRYSKIVCGKLRSTRRQKALRIFRHHPLPMYVMLLYAPDALPFQRRIPNTPQRRTQMPYKPPLSPRFPILEQGGLSFPGTPLNPTQQENRDRKLKCQTPYPSAFFPFLVVVMSFSSSGQYPLVEALYASRGLLSIFCLHIGHLCLCASVCSAVVRQSAQKRWPIPPLATISHLSGSLSDGDTPWHPTSP